jgi:hypothetical protein
MGVSLQAVHAQKYSSPSQLVPLVLSKSVWVTFGQNMTDGLVAMYSMYAMRFLECRFLAMSTFAWLPCQLPCQLPCSTMGPSMPRCPANNAMQDFMHPGQGGPASPGGANGAVPGNGMDGKRTGHVRQHASALSVPALISFT